MHNPLDIVELLRDFVTLLDQGGIQRTSTESRLMLAAADEIEELRKQLEFQTSLAQKYNHSRLNYMDTLLAAGNAYEDLCRQVVATSDTTSDSLPSLCCLCNHFGEESCVRGKGCFSLNHREWNRKCQEAKQPKLWEAE